jgi:hypothetical protein
MRALPTGVAEREKTDQGDDSGPRRLKDCAILFVLMYSIPQSSDGRQAGNHTMRSQSCYDLLPHRPTTRSGADSVSEYMRSSNVQCIVWFRGPACRAALASCSESSGLFFYHFL